MHYGICEMVLLCIWLCFVVVCLQSAKSFDAGLTYFRVASLAFIPQCRWSNPEESGLYITWILKNWLHDYIKRNHHNKTEFIFHGIYCVLVNKHTRNSWLNRHQTILQTFLNFFLNLTLPGVPHLYKQLPNGQYLSDLCKMCNLDANLWKRWIGDHRIMTYIFKWERLNTTGHSHSVSIGHWVAPLHND